MCGCHLRAGARTSGLRSTIQNRRLRHTSWVAFGPHPPKCCQGPPLANSGKESREGGEGFVRQSPEVLPKSDAPGPAVRPNSCCQETDGGEAWESEELAQATFIAYLSPGYFSQPYWMSRILNWPDHALVFPSSGNVGPKTTGHLNIYTTTARLVLEPSRGSRRDPWRKHRRCIFDPQQPIWPLYPRG